MIDTHCHLDLEPLRSSLPLMLREADAAGVRLFVVPGVHPDNWSAIALLAEENPQILPSFGVHPLHAGCLDEQLLGRLRERAAHCVAIGETGLDPAYAAPMELQERAFRDQARIAVSCGKPLLIHCRRAFQRVAQILREERAERVGGIMHAFSGSVEMAREFIRLGFAISISGTVTWSNAVKPLRLARELPLECLVLETDAPDMTPEPYRGTPNRPAWIAETALRVAKEREIPLAEVSRITTANARRFLRLESGAA